MKLFHWHTVEALRDYGSGDVIIMAPDLETAREVFRKENPDNYDGVVDEIERNDPDSIYDNPASISLRGSA